MGVNSTVIVSLNVRLTLTRESQPLTACKTSVPVGLSSSYTTPLTTMLSPAQRMGLKSTVASIRKFRFTLMIESQPVAVGSTSVPLGFPSS